MRRVFVLWGLIAAAGVFTSRGWGAELSTGAEAEARLGLRWLAEGNVERALPLLERAARRLDGERHWDLKMAALVALGSAAVGLGQYCDAEETLEEAAGLARRKGDSLGETRALAALGTVHLFSRRFDKARPLLEQGLKAASGATNAAWEAVMRLNLGLLAGAAGAAEPGQGRRLAGVRGLAPEFPLEPEPKVARLSEESREQFERAARLAQGLTNPALEMEVLLNHGRAAWDQGDEIEARRIAGRARALASETGALERRPLLLLSSGELAWEVERGNSEAREWAEGSWRGVYHRSGPEDHSIASHALGALGKAAWERRDFEQGLALTLRALERAQHGNLEEARFHWTWQAARFLEAQGRDSDAVQAYQQAVELLRPLRGDFLGALGGAGLRGTFRETSGRVYEGYASLLLKQAAAEPRSEAKAMLLSWAQQAIESLRSAQIAEYFLEPECVSLMQSRTQKLSDPKGAAVVYVISLEDRLEMLVWAGGGLTQVSSRVAREELEGTVREMHDRLISPSGADPRQPGLKLWNWLIKPLELVLPRGREKVETLVFVTDARLAAIPMAALHDGREYLAEKYATAVSPGLALMPSQPLGRVKLNPLLCGVSEAIFPFTALPKVTNELDAIQKRIGGRKLLDESFTVRTFEEALKQGRHSVVHIASHGVFGGDADSTFVLARDGDLTMAKLEELILPRMLSKNPIELLVLSACQTAAGDERAALGLAGLAVKSGARSAIASLWNVSDDSTAVLMTNLYARLDKARGLSRAAALREAQLELLRGDYAHPFYWSAFVLIGQWL